MDLIHSYDDEDAGEGPNVELSHTTNSEAVENNFHQSQLKEEQGCVSTHTNNHISITDTTTSNSSSLPSSSSSSSSSSTMEQMNNDNESNNNNNLNNYTLRGIDNNNTTNGDKVTDNSDYSGYSDNIIFSANKFLHIKKESDQNNKMIYSNYNNSNNNNGDSKLKGSCGVEVCPPQMVELLGLIETEAAAAQTNNSNNNNSNSNNHLENGTNDNNAAQLKESNSNFQPQIQVQDEEEKNFYSQLHPLLKAQKISGSPLVHKVPLNLFKLYTEVTKRGGYTEESHLWMEIGPLFEPSVAEKAKAVHSILKRHYRKYLSAYESSYFKKDLPTPSPKKVTPAISNVPIASPNDRSPAFSSLSPKEGFSADCVESPESPFSNGSPESSSSNGGHRSHKKRKRLDPVLYCQASSNWQSPCGLGVSKSSRHSFNSIMAGLTHRDKELQEKHLKWAEENDEIKRQVSEEKKRVSLLAVSLEYNSEGEDISDASIEKEENFKEAETVVLFSRRLFTKKIIQHTRELYQKSRKPKTVYNNYVNYKYNSPSTTKLEEYPFPTQREQLKSHFQALAKFQQIKRESIDTPADASTLPEPQTSKEKPGKKKPKKTKEEEEEEGVEFPKNKNMLKLIASLDQQLKDYFRSRQIGDDGDDETDTDSSG